MEINITLHKMKFSVLSDSFSFGESRVGLSFYPRGGGGFQCNHRMDLFKHVYMSPLASSRSGHSPCMDPQPWPSSPYRDAPHLAIHVVVKLSKLTKYDVAVRARDPNQCDCHTAAFTLTQNNTTYRLLQSCVF